MWLGVYVLCARLNNKCVVRDHLGSHDMGIRLILVLFALQS